MKTIAIADAVITTDNSMFYYGSKKKFKQGKWEELDQMVSMGDLNNPYDCEAINTMFVLAKRRKKKMLLDRAFLKNK